MALQRTRGLVAVRSVRGAGVGLAIQPLPGGRSPLNAGSLCCQAKSSWPKYETPEIGTR